MNKWKIAFWICLTLLVLVTAFSFYSILDQGVTITYMKDGYVNTENDLKTLSKIINETDLSKTQIKRFLEHSSEFNEYSQDTVSLERVGLVFKNDTLKKITFQW